jgi:hypothetical protein
MWNDTDTPLAHLITFRCYGTWLHGDERGSIDRSHNQYGSPYIAHNKKWELHNTQSLRQEPVTLDSTQRTSVEQAIRTTCDLRQWCLRAINVRTNHIHIVVSRYLRNERSVEQAIDYVINGQGGPLPEFGKP